MNGRCSVLLADEIGDGVDRLVYDVKDMILPSEKTVKLRALLQTVNFQEKLATKMSRA